MSNIDKESGNYVMTLKSRKRRLERVVITKILISGPYIYLIGINVGTIHPRRLGSPGKTSKNSQQSDRFPHPWYGQSFHLGYSLQVIYFKLSLLYNPPDFPVSSLSLRSVSSCYHLWTNDGDPDVLLSFLHHNDIESTVQVTSLTVHFRYCYLPFKQ